MAKSSKLRVMLSSRCNDSFPPGAATTLSDIRRELKTEIEAMEIAGRKAFDVWINEETDPQGGKWDSWDVCIEAVKDCDILLVISNGNAGWADGGGEIGICHAEMMTALSIAPGKVRLITVGEIDITADDAGKRNKRFQDEIAKQSLFRGATVSTVEQLKGRTTDALHDAVIALAQAGVREASRGKFHSGAALDWTRLDFSERQSEMIRVLRDAVKARLGAFEESAKLFVKVGGCDILTELHAIPAALTVGPARELVGQPFLKDHLVATSLSRGRGGPLHIIACHRTATESQASRMLGFPDATFVSASFGVFVADPIQRVQFAFITNCRDETNTRHGLQRFFEWMTQSGEDKLVAERAQSRARIVRAIAEGIIT
jgi:hypothetical protein